MPSSIADGESGLSARTKINEGFVDITHGGADNALLKADGADATLQSSGIICDDSDNLSGLGTILPVSDEAKDMGSTTLAFQDAYIKRISFDDGSNYLDDYEEGTTTLTMRDATSGGNTGSTATAYYSKVGNICHLDVFYANMSTAGMTAGNTLYFTGLPFTQHASTGNTGVAAPDTINLDAGYSQLNIRGTQNTDYFRLLESGDNVAVSNIIISQISSGTSDLFLQLSYLTT